MFIATDSWPIANANINYNQHTNSSNYTQANSFRL